jgi:hypothetical protein
VTSPFDTRPSRPSPAEELEGEDPLLEESLSERNPGAAAPRVGADPAAAAPPDAPRKGGALRSLLDRSRDYFLGYDPSFVWVVAPLLLLSIVLFCRMPDTNFIFDEQEALLANPYVNGAKGLRFIDAIRVDFWGLPPDRSVGSYRPLPNFLWRAVWNITRLPFVHQFYNVVLHAVNGALLTQLVFRLTRRRGMSWLAGFAFVGSAILTEAVSGVVGIADVLGGMGALFALLALALPGWAMPFAVFAGVLFGLFSKESALVCVPLVPFAALVSAPLFHPEKPQRALRTLLALLGAGAAFILYVELRRRWFPSPLPAELEVPLPENASAVARGMRALLVWFHQAPLPRDPLNNPLAEADFPSRLAGALRVYFRGLVQVVFPRTLSGDYSFPQEPVPDRFTLEIAAGAVFMIVPPIVGVAAWIVGMRREREARAESARHAPAAEPAAQPRSTLVLIARVTAAFIVLLALAAPFVEAFVLRPRGVGPIALGLPRSFLALPAFFLGVGILVELGRARPRAEPKDAPLSLERACLALVAIGTVWVVVSYFPHSNIPVVLPTVRAERFWYFPVLGTSMLIAAFFAGLHGALSRWRRAFWVAPALFAVFFSFQCVKAYLHAMDYRSDLAFWEATKNAVPRSAKAHLNYSVMKGARSDMQTRLSESLIALDLAPQWPMAHIYTGDALCRMGRPDDAWPHYAEGFDRSPNDTGLISLALQCLWDTGKLEVHEDELRELAEKHKGSWLAFLAVDTLDNGKEHRGVNPKYRPRSYNEGPKDE